MEEESATREMGLQKPGGRRAAAKGRSKRVEEAPSMRKYECTFVARSDLSQDQVDAIVKDIEDFVVAQGGSVSVREGYTIAQTARPIRRHKKAIYVVLNVECPPHVRGALTDRLRLISAVLLFMMPAVLEFKEGPTAISMKRMGSSYHEGREGRGEGSSDRFQDRRGGGYSRRVYGSHGSSSSSSFGSNEEGSGGAQERPRLSSMEENPRQSARESEYAPREHRGGGSVA